ncbi:hypothetical protein DENSPDRAFT_821487 [Dentipellis sp. KUC8613]|nr:hypothetical protein DENSPDRAFT_821487 [Dentipellis sp. KUC8613]
MASAALAARNAVQRFRYRELANLSKEPLVAATANSKPESSKLRNPFVPYKNPDSGRWAPPKYSLRRQADLIKQARKTGLLHLLPPGPKLSAAQLKAARPSPSASVDASAAPEAAAQEETVDWQVPVKWEGKVRVHEVAGADVGNRLYAGKKRMFKGHKWEREREKRVKRIQVRLRDMDKRVRQYKMHYHKRRPNPLSTRTSTSKKASKMPF